MEVTGAHVVMSAWVVALAVTLVLWVVRRSVLPALAVGPLVAVAWIVEVSRMGNTVVREDVVVLFIASMLGASAVALPAAYIRWVMRVLREAERRILNG